MIKSWVKMALRTEEEGRRVSADFIRLLRNAGTSSTLLDVGCGDGSETLLYSEALGVPETGLHGIEAQRKYFETAKNRFKVEVLDLEKDRFPYSDGIFDLVTCNQLLEHLKNIFLPLSEMERVLKVGGHLAVGIPNLTALHNRVLMLFGRQPTCNHLLGPHVRCYSHHAFSEFLAANPNFEFRGVTGSSLYPLPYPLVSVGGRLAPSLAAYTFYLLRKTGGELERSTWRVDSIGDTLL